MAVLGRRARWFIPTPIYRIEGEPSRRGDGLYDRMGSVGAHELLLENPHHDRHLWDASDAEVEQFLRLMAQRIQDLKRDSRFKYVSIFKNSRNQRRTGVRPSHFATDGNDVCAAARALRIAGGARLLRQ